jgi:hypothetical protein
MYRASRKQKQAMTAHAVQRTYKEPGTLAAWQQLTVLGAGIQYTLELQAAELAQRHNLGRQRIPQWV